MREVGVLNELLDSITIAVDRIRSLYSKRDSSSEEEEFGECCYSISSSYDHVAAARRLSGMANLLDLGAVFGDKIRARFMQSALESSLISKELQSGYSFNQILRSHDMNDCSGDGFATQRRRRQAEARRCR